MEGKMNERQGQTCNDLHFCAAFQTSFGFCFFFFVALPRFGPEVATSAKRARQWDTQCDLHAKRMGDADARTQQCARTSVAVIAIVQRVVVLIVILLCYPALLVPVVLLQRGKPLALDLLPHVLIEDPDFG